MKNDIKRIVALLITIAMVMTNVLSAFADICVEDIVDDAEEIITYELEPEIDEDILEENIDDEVVVDDEEEELKEEEIEDEEIEDEISYEDETESDEEIEEESINDENIEEPEYDEEIEDESINDENFEEPEYDEETNCDDEKIDEEEIEEEIINNDESSDENFSSEEINIENAETEDIDEGTIESENESEDACLVIDDIVEYEDLNLLTAPNSTDKISIYQCYYPSTNTSNCVLKSSYPYNESYGNFVGAGCTQAKFDGCVGYYSNEACTSLVESGDTLHYKEEMFNHTYYAKIVDNVKKLTIKLNDGGTSQPTIFYRMSLARKWYSNSACTNEGSSIQAPKRTGYILAGWDGFDLTYNSFNNTYYLSEWDDISSDTTATAKWEPKVYTISFDNQSPTSGGISEDLYMIFGRGVYTDSAPDTAESNKKTSIDCSGIKKDNYSFGGFYTSKNGQGTCYISSDGTINIPINVELYNQQFDNNITLYAFWDVIKYDVSFNTDGGNTISPIKVNQGSKITKPTDPIKEGYDFKYWYTTDANTAFDFENTTVTANVTLNAKWEIHKYNVTFNLDGGTGSADAQQIAYKGKVTRPSDPTKTNYDFIRWCISGNESVAYDFSQEVTSDLVIKAVWDIHKNTIKFNTNGGNSIDDARVESGNKLTKPTNPTKTGYDFKYWYTTDSNTEFNFDTEVNGDFTLNALWEIHKYNIKFNTDGGTEIDDTTVEYNKLLAKPTAPTKEGYKFINWYGDSSFSDVFDFSIPITQDKNIYAKFVLAYKLTFDTKGGSSIGVQLVEENTAPTRPSNPSRSGYKFVDWYEVKIVEEDEQEVVFDFAEALTENKTIFAKWEALPKNSIQTSSSSHSSSSGGSSSHQNQIFFDKASIKKLRDGIYKSDSIVLFTDYEKNPRFEVINGNIRLTDNNGPVKNKLFTDTSNGNVFAFDENGDMLKGWLINGDGAWYYFNEGQGIDSGILSKGMGTIDGMTYLVDIKTGQVMQNAEFNGIKTDAFGQVLQGINT